MTTIIAYVIVAAVFVADIAVSYTIGKAAIRLISRIVETIRKLFR